MNLSLFLWFLVWAGMYSSPYYLRYLEFLVTPSQLFEATRSLLPILALCICVLQVLPSQIRLIPPLKTPLGCLFGYFLAAIGASLLLSPSVFDASYWGVMYLSPLLVIHSALTTKGSSNNIRKIIYCNYVFAIIMTLVILPEALRYGYFVRMEIYQLPFNLGIIKANGVGRFALVVVILSFVRLITQTTTKRFLWLILFFPSLYLLMQAQSRSTLLGFTVAGILIIYLKGMDWRFLFVGPLGAYVVWLSGFQWRAHGSIARLLDLRGRDLVWKKGLAQFIKSPLFGWGFHADRLLLNFQHMHNSYFHALVQSGIVGTFFFTSAIIRVWNLIFRNNLHKQVRNLQSSDQALLIESIVFLAFLTVRSLFESTGAFYGVDLLVLAPIIGYIQLSIQKNT